MPVVLVQVVIDPNARGAHHEVYADDTTEDLLWAVEFWRQESRFDPGGARAGNVRTALMLHCL